MQAIVDYFASAVASFPQYPRWLYIVTVLGIIGLTEAAKLPIKHFTKKVKNEKTRRLINLTVMAVPIALSLALGGFYTLIPARFSIVACVSWATSAMIIYEFAERIVQRLKKGEKITNETVEQDFNDAKKEVQQGVDNVTKNVKKADEEFQKEIDKVLNKKGK